MLWLSPFLTVVLAMILFLFAVFILKKGHQIGILQKESQLLIDRMNTFVPSVIRNIVSINLNNAQNFIFNKFNEINSKLRDLSVQIFV